MKQLFILIPILFSTYACKKSYNVETTYVESNYCTVSNPKHQQVVLLVLGQSNAANASNELMFSNCNKTLNFYQGELYPLKDPLKGANGEGGSVWTRLAVNLLKVNFANEIIIAPTAIGGTAIEQWIPSGNLNYLITETINNIQNSGLEITHVLWHQGESNNSALNPSIAPQQNANNYANNFMLLVEYLRSKNVQAPIFIAQASRCATLPIDTLLLQAQVSVANDSLNIYQGPNTDLLGNEYRYDDCHFNGTGLQIHAYMWAEKLQDF